MQEAKRYALAVKRCSRKSRSFHCRSASIARSINALPPKGRCDEFAHRCAAVRQCRRGCQRGFHNAATI